jgi:hypothetical protein
MHWLRGEDVESLCTDMNKSRNNKHYDFIDLIMHFKDGYISQMRARTGSSNMQTFFHAHLSALGVTKLSIRNGKKVQKNCSLVLF